MGGFGLMLIVDPEDEGEVAPEPIVGLPAFVPLKLWKECLVLVCCHLITLSRCRRPQEVAECAPGAQSLLPAIGSGSYACTMTQENINEKRTRTTPIVSMKTQSGEIVEMLFRAENAECRLVTVQGDSVDEHETLNRDGREYVPYSSTNNLLTHRVLLLASEVGTYPSVEALVERVRSFIHKYVDLSDVFEEIAAHYVLLTWVYDRFNELPYLRVRGDYGSGKSRFLLTVGSLCWKPIFASGASTVSPLFRLIDEVGGVLVVDEADFWASDERAEIVKILNNGNARGFPVLRSEVTPSKEFRPRAFNIFGPKLVATRHEFEDEALESRCLTETLGRRPLRGDIPISLPSVFDEEALALRNMLLRYRFDHASVEPTARDADRGVEPRRMQILAPMLDVAVDDDARIRMRSFIGSVNSVADRDKATIRLVLTALAKVQSDQLPLTVGAVAERLRNERSGAVGVMTDRWVGGVLRRLGLEPQKSNGVYRISVSDQDCLPDLFQQYGVCGDDESGEQKSAT